MSEWHTNIPWQSDSLDRCEQVERSKSRVTRWDVVKTHPFASHRLMYVYCILHYCTALQSRTYVYQGGLSWACVFHMYIVHWIQKSFHWVVSLHATPASARTHAPDLCITFMYYVHKYLGTLVHVVHAWSSCRSKVQSVQFGILLSWPIIRFFLFIMDIFQLSLLSKKS